jgi:hypothetical protein
VQHHRAILADRVQHHRLTALRRNLPHDMDAFRLKLSEMAVGFAHWHDGQKVVLFAWF